MLTYSLCLSFLRLGLGKLAFVDLLNGGVEMLLALRKAFKLILDGTLLLLG